MRGLPIFVSFVFVIVIVGIKFSLAVEKTNEDVKEEGADNLKQEDVENFEKQEFSPFINLVIASWLKPHSGIPELIKRDGFPVEMHYVVSPDDYETTLFRIPHGRLNKPSKGPKKVALLHHGITADGGAWILNSVEKALAYRLADLGTVDVWLINNRGTQYSLGHEYLSSNNHLYWNFSFHEIGAKDVPAIIDYILGLTKQSDLYYIGHSMGCTTFFIALSEFPEYNSKIRTFIGLAPAVLVGHATTPFTAIAPLALSQQAIHDAVLYSAAVPPQIIPLLQIVGIICSPRFAARICFAVVDAIYGYDFKETDYDMAEEIVANAVGSTSSKTIYHFFQLYKERDFKQYNYADKRINERLYGQSWPPKYNLSKVAAPVVINGGLGDTVVVPQDLYALRDVLLNVVEFKLVSYPHFNHIDFLFAKDINPLVNDRLIEIIDKDLYYKPNK